MRRHTISVVVALFCHACSDDSGTPSRDQGALDGGDVDASHADDSILDTGPDLVDAPLQDAHAEIGTDLPQLADIDLIDDFDAYELDTRPPELPLACGLNIVEIALYQSVRVPLMQDGLEDVEDRAPIIPGKRAMLRIHVQRQLEWTPREVFGRVVLQSDNGNSWHQTSITVDFDSSVEDLSTTFNLDIPGRDINADTRWSVSLVEINSESAGAGNCDQATWPPGEPTSLGVEPEGAPIEIVLVPVRYNADDSGRVPDTSPEQLQRYEDTMFSVYPVQQVELTVVEPMDWDESVQPNGEGWDNLLNAIVELREDGAPAPHVYYYGLVTPTELETDYAGVTGLAFIPFVEDSWARCAVGLGYSGQTSAEIMLHEVAHNHGRSHAPCGSTAGVDPNFPYPDGNIGEWGYDLLNMELKNPIDVYDTMTYCEPVWVSDYTYSRLFERTMAVHELSDSKASFASLRAWASLCTGSNEPGPTLNLHTPPTGEERTVLWLNAAGNIVEEVTGSFIPYDHLDSGLVVYPMPSDDVVSVRVVDWRSTCR